MQDVTPEQTIEEWRVELEAELLRLPRLFTERISSAEVISSSFRRESTLVKASQYVLGSGGKRLRALLTLGIAHDLAVSARQKVRSKAITVGVAIEALHAASLIHDDLPALDDDDMRRGKPSCHKAFDEATALLTGDALYGAALHRITTDKALSSDEQGRLSGLLSRAWVDLCLGQDLDILHQRASGGSGGTDGGDTGCLVRLKTGALFGAAAAGGALCAGVRDGALNAYWRWGVRVGECFQALDDLDDGDRPKSEREEIHRECLATHRELADLASQLSSGVTAPLVKMILAL